MYLNKLWTDFDEFFGWVGRGQSTKRLDFGGHLDQDPNPGFLDPGFLDPENDPDPEFFLPRAVDKS